MRFLKNLSILSIGLALGAAIASITIPYSGKTNRAKLKAKFEESKDKMNEQTIDHRFNFNKLKNNLLK